MSSTTFDCVACVETFSTQPIAVLNHRMCPNCCQAGIVSQFHAALRDPTSYPVKYTGQELDIDNFTHFFDAQFLRDWATKKDEYDTPIAERIYCAGGTCGRYLGLRSDHRSTTHCPSCGGRTCADCSSIWLNNRHVCERDESEPLEGQQRGRDYQLCPGCNSIPIYLEDGCNHMTCKASGSCRTEFCYVCGGEVVSGENSGHWNVGMPCPRFGQPGDENAIYTEPGNPETDIDAVVVQQLEIGIVLAGAEQPPPRDAPPELEARYADRLILRRIAREALDALEGDLGDDTAWMSRVSLLASGLLSSIEAYALHLNPDPEARLDGLAMVEMLHPYIQSWYGTAGDEGHNRFPALRPIYERYVRARGERLRERGLGDGH